MAAPTLQAEGTTLAVTTGAPAVVLPAHQANDILVCSAIYWGPNTAGDAAQIPIPSGWTLIGSQVGQPAASPRDGWLAWFWRRALGSSETITLTTGVGWDSGAATCYGARVYVIRGAETAGNPWDAAVSAGPYVTGTNSFAALTVSAAERLAIHFGNQQDNTGWGGMTGWTSGTISTSTVGTDCSFQTYRKDNVSANTSAAGNNNPLPAQGAYAYMGVSFKPPTGAIVRTAPSASATASRPAPLPKLSATAVRASATASRALPLPKLKVIPPVGAATASRPVPLPKLKVGPSAARATASAPVPLVQAGTSAVITAPPARATASFPAPAHASSLLAAAPPASATASRATPTPKLGLAAPKGSATAGAPVPLPSLKVLPSAASATASGVVPTTRTVVLGVPVAGATAQGRVPIPTLRLGPSAARAIASFPAPHLPTPTSGRANLPTRLRYARNRTTLALHGPTTLVLDPGLTTLDIPDEEMELVLDG